MSGAASLGAEPGGGCVAGSAGKEPCSGEEFLYSCRCDEQEEVAALQRN